MKTITETDCAIYVYGLAHCTSVKKARAWLDGQDLPYHFHDFKKLGLPAELLQAWLLTVSWQTLINRQGSTWRGLDQATRLNLTDEAAAVPLLLAKPSLIKRPLVLWPDGAISVGFVAASFADRAKSLPLRKLP